MCTTIRNRKIISILTGILFVLWSGCKKEDSNTISSTTAVFNPNLIYGTMTDQDGNICKNIQIGTQVWMAENLKAARYRNGDPVATTNPATLNIAGEANPVYQWAATDDGSSMATYGRLYTWVAVTDSRKIAPPGWHIASYNEWITLRDFLGGENLAGGKLKETSTTHWISPNTGATNESGFTALPGCLCEPSGTFNPNGQYGNWWTSTESVSSKAWHAYSDGVTSNLLLLSSSKSVGYPVRCVKD